MTKPKSTFREEFERQALQARKSMVRDGELLPEDEFRRRLAINDKQLARLVESGSVFSIEVDGIEYYPALLAEAASACSQLAEPWCQLRLGRGSISCRRHEAAWVTEARYRCSTMTMISSVCNKRPPHGLQGGRALP
jgi:hypothetical protein